MIVAVCAPVLDPESRSRSVAAVLAAIERAAGLQPAPDLVVLPDCFAGSPAGPRPGRLSAAMCTAFCETVGRTAREWGVWIAAGHPAVMGGRVVAAASVFDPDADVFIRHCAEQTWAVRNTPLGRWTLRSAQSLRGRLDWGFAGAGLAIVPADSASEITAEQLADAAGRARCAACIARPRLLQSEGATQTPANAIIAANGQVLARDDGAGLICAELIVPVVEDTELLMDAEALE